MLNLTQRHRDNLQTLANYLATVPKKSFNMSTFESECGNIACAVGHGPAAGIGEHPGTDWWRYARTYFVAENVEVWHWIFGKEWCLRDNTPEGARKRIQHYLEHGAPTLERIEEMLHKGAPLPY